MATLPAQRLRMGSTTYYLASMKAAELLPVFRTAAEIWADEPNLSIEDRIQRDVNRRRLFDEVIPYLAKHEDRFFGSVIILLQGAEVQYESLTSLWETMPIAYQGPASKIGFVTISGGVWIVLDGQHRLVALSEIWKRNYTESYDPALFDDDISIVFIEFETTVKTRRIFNKVNRYARSTSRADNLILSEDDGYAIIARRLFNDSDAPLRSGSGDGDGLVNWKNNTISGRSLQLTTISALSIIVQDVCTCHGIMLDEKSSGGVRAEEALIDQGYQLCRDWIEAAFAGIQVLQRCRTRPTLLPVERELEMPYSLLLKPAGQIALFRAASRARTLLGSDFDLRWFMAQAGHIDWSLAGAVWNNVIVMAGRRVLAKQQNYDDAAAMIVWQVYGKTGLLPEVQRRLIHQRWAELQSTDAGAAPNLPEPLNTEWPGPQR